MVIKDKLKYFALGSIVLASAGMNGCGTIGNAIGGLEHKISGENHKTTITPINWESPGEKANNTTGEEDEKYQNKKPISKTPESITQETKSPENENELLPKLPEFIYREYSPNKNNISPEVSLFGPPNSRAEAQRKEALERIHANKKVEAAQNTTYQKTNNSDTLYILPENQRNEKSVLMLADALYLEGRGVHEDGKFEPREDYLDMIAATIIKRTVKGHRGAKNLNDVINSSSQYSFTRKDDGQNKFSTKVREHAKKNHIEWIAYKKCVEVAKESVYEGISIDIDHFFVRGEKDLNKLPDWAVGKKPAETIGHKSHYRGAVQDCVTRCYRLL